MPPPSSSSPPHCHRHRHHHLTVKALGSVWLAVDSMECVWFNRKHKKSSFGYGFRAKGAFQFPFCLALNMRIPAIVLQHRCDVRTLIMEEAHATKYYVLPRVNEAVARYGVHVSSIPDRDGMYIEVLERDVEVVRNASGYDSFREMSFPTRIVVIRVFDVFSLEALYGRRGLSKPKIVKRVKLIVGMKLLEYSVGDHVMMKVSPWKGVVRFGMKSKLAPRYVGPIEILERINPVTYRSRLPEELSIEHYLGGVKFVMLLFIPLCGQPKLYVIKVDRNLRFVEEFVGIIDRKVK
nr:reverse transcriptase domain-containing protein [Tanacetum cinerariifolium]